MEKQYHGNTVEHWRQNAEEDYMTTPISVLKYITVLEEKIKDLQQFNCVGPKLVNGVKPCEQWCGDNMCLPQCKSCGSYIKKSKLCPDSWHD